MHSSFTPAYLRNNINRRTTSLRSKNTPSLITKPWVPAPRHEKIIKNQGTFSLAMFKFLNFFNQLNNKISIQKRFRKLTKIILGAFILIFWALFIVKYLSYQKFFVINDKSSSRLLYPAITFCNNGKYFKPMGDFDVLRSWAIDSSIYTKEQLKKKNSTHILGLHKYWLKDYPSFQKLKSQNNDLNQLYKELPEDMKECFEHGEEVSNDHDHSDHRENDKGINGTKRHHHIKKTSKEISLLRKKQAALKKIVAKRKKKLQPLPLKFYNGSFIKFMDVWGWNLTEHPKTAGKRYIHDKKDRLGHKDIHLVYAQFGRVQLTRDDFHKIYTTEGVCYTFNGEQKLRNLKPRVVSGIGPKEGLDIILNVKDPMGTTIYATESVPLWSSG